MNAGADGVGPLMEIVAVWHARAMAKLREAKGYPEGSMQKQSLIQAAMKEMDRGYEFAASIAPSARVSPPSS